MRLCGNSYNFRCGHCSWEGYISPGKRPKCKLCGWDPEKAHLYEKSR